MRVGPSAPHRRAQTSDLENYPGSTMGRSPQQQAGVYTVTRRFNRRLTASSAEPCFCVLSSLSFYGSFSLLLLSDVCVVFDTCAWRRR